jgi:hypothetical protein
MARSTWPRIIALISTVNQQEAAFDLAVQHELCESRNLRDAY